MGDLDMLKAMLDRAGIGYEIDSETSTTLTVRNDGQNNVDGFVGFAVDFGFSPDGDLVNVGIWED